MNLSGLRVLNALIDVLKRLPGVGPKMAERMALHLVRTHDGELLLKTLTEAKSKLSYCKFCGSLAEGDTCDLCSDPGRNKNILCVVEEIADIEAIERSHAHKGLFHVLGGTLSPLDGVGPSDLRIGKLLERIKSQGIKEIIIATNTTIEGETTATYINSTLKPLGIHVTRLGYGLPSGSSIEHSDEFTITKAFENRKEV